MGYLKLLRYFERWDDANKMQVRQLDKAELIRSKEIGNKKYYEETREL